MKAAVRAGCSVVENWDSGRETENSDSGIGARTMALAASGDQAVESVTDGELRDGTVAGTVQLELRQ